MQFFPKKFIPLPPSLSMSSMQYTNRNIKHGQFLNFREAISAVLYSQLSDTKSDERNPLLSLLQMCISLSTKIGFLPEILHGLSLESKTIKAGCPFFHIYIFKWEFCLAVGLLLLCLKHQAHTTGNSHICAHTQHHGGLVFNHLLTRMAKSCYSYPRRRVAQSCMSKSLVISCES